MAPSLSSKLQQLRLSGIVADTDSYDAQLKKVVKTLTDVSTQDLSQPDLLEDLDPSHDTLPYLFSLHARLGASLPSAGKAFPESLAAGGEFWQKVASFLKLCDPVQIRYAGKQWTDLVCYLADTYGTDSRSDLAIPVLSHVAVALLRLDPGSEVLTTTHIRLIHSVLSHQTRTAIEQWLPILDKDIRWFAAPKIKSIDGTPLCSKQCRSSVYINQASGFSGKLSVQEVQEYYLLGAQAYIAVRRWSRALLFLEHVLATPTTGQANGLMLEAYRKWILVGLLGHGPSLSSPRMLSNKIMNSLKALSKPYDGIWEAATKGTYKKLLAEADEGTKTWQNDGNTGLLQQVVADHRRRAVTKLGKIYAAVPLRLVAEKLEMSDGDTHAYLSQLIEQGYLRGQLDQSKTSTGITVLRFSDDGEAARSTSEAVLKDELEAQTRRIRDLEESINDADHQLLMTKEYVEHTRKTRRNKDDIIGGDEESMDVSFGGPTASDDDDVMTDAG